MSSHGMRLRTRNIASTTSNKTLSVEVKTQNSTRGRPRKSTPQNISYTFKTESPTQNLVIVLNDALGKTPENLGINNSSSFFHLGSKNSSKSETPKRRQFYNLVYSDDDENSCSSTDSAKIEILTKKAEELNNTLKMLKQRKEQKKKDKEDSTRMTNSNVTTDSHEFQNEVEHPTVKLIKNSTPIPEKRGRKRSKKSATSTMLSSGFSSGPSQETLTPVSSKESQPSIQLSDQPLRNSLSSMIDAEIDLLVNSSSVFGNKPSTEEEDEFERALTELGEGTQMQSNLSLAQEARRSEAAAMKELETRRKLEYPNCNLQSKSINDCSEHEAEDNAGCCTGETEPQALPLSQDIFMDNSTTASEDLRKSLELEAEIKETEATENVGIENQNFSSQESNVQVNHPEMDVDAAIVQALGSYEAVLPSRDLFSSPEKTPCGNIKQRWKAKFKNSHNFYEQSSEQESVDTLSNDFPSLTEQETGQLLSSSVVKKTSILESFPEERSLQMNSEGMDPTSSPLRNSIHTVEYSNSVAEMHVQEEKGDSYESDSDSVTPTSQSNKNLFGECLNHLKCRVLKNKSHKQRNCSDNGTDSSDSEDQGSTSKCKPLFSFNRPEQKEFVGEISQDEATHLASPRETTSADTENRPDIKASQASLNSIGGKSSKNVTDTTMHNTLLERMISQLNNTDKPMENKEETRNRPVTWRTLSDEDSSSMDEADSTEQISLSSMSSNYLETKKSGLEQEGKDYELKKLPTSTDCSYDTTVPSLKTAQAVSETSSDILSKTGMTIFDSKKSSDDEILRPLTQVKITRESSLGKELQSPVKQSVRRNFSSSEGETEQEVLTQRMCLKKRTKGVRKKKIRKELEKSATVRKSRQALKENVSKERRLSGIMCQSRNDTVACPKINNDLCFLSKTTSPTMSTSLSTDNTSIEKKISMSSKLTKPNDGMKFLNSKRKTIVDSSEIIPASKCSTVMQSSFNSNMCSDEEIFQLNVNQQITPENTIGNKSKVEVKSNKAVKKKLYITKQSSSDSFSNSDEEISKTNLENVSALEQMTINKQLTIIAPETNRGEDVGFLRSLVRQENLQVSKSSSDLVDCNDDKKGFVVKVKDSSPLVSSVQNNKPTLYSFSPDDPSTDDNVSAPSHQYAKYAVKKSKSGRDLKGGTGERIIESSLALDKVPLTFEVNDESNDVNNEMDESTLWVSLTQQSVIQGGTNCCNNSSSAEEYVSDNLFDINKCGGKIPKTFSNDEVELCKKQKKKKKKKKKADKEKVTEGNHMDEVPLTSEENSKTKKKNTVKKVNKKTKETEQRENVKSGTSGVKRKNQKTLDEVESPRQENESLGGNEEDESSKKQKGKGNTAKKKKNPLNEEAQHETAQLSSGQEKTKEIKKGKKRKVEEKALEIQQQTNVNIELQNGHGETKLPKSKKKNRNKLDEQVMKDNVENESTPELVKKSKKKNKTGASKPQEIKKPEVKAILNGGDETDGVKLTEDRDDQDEEICRLPSHFLKDLAAVKPHSSIRQQKSKPSQNAEKSKEKSVKDSNDFIPLETAGPTKFAAVPLDAAPIGREKVVANFKKDMLFGKRVRRTPVKSLEVVKKKRKANL